jgi:hypothetical protein
MLIGQPNTIATWALSIKNRSIRDQWPQYNTDSVDEGESLQTYENHTKKNQSVCIK